MFPFSRPLQSTLSKPGRKEDVQMLDHFEKVCKWLENELAPVSTSEVHEKMTELANGADVYSIKQMKRKLEDKYGDDIVITQSDGKANLVCFKNVAQFIISKMEKVKGSENEGEMIVKTAARLIKAEINNQNFNIDEYPSKTDIEKHQNSLVPLLHLFMKELNPNELKQSSIGQAITNCYCLDWG